jgi:hypothetical protein
MALYRQCSGGAGEGDPSFYLAEKKPKNLMCNPFLIPYPSFVMKCRMEGEAGNDDGGVMLFASAAIRERPVRARKLNSGDTL